MQTFIVLILVFFVILFLVLVFNNKKNVKETKKDYLKTKKIIQKITYDGAFIDFGFIVNNKPSLMDAVLISNKAVYCIQILPETGDLFGKEDDENWTVVRRKNNKVYIKNPFIDLKENSLNLCSRLNIPEDFPLVQFVVVTSKKTNFTNIDSTRLISIKNLKKYIKTQEKLYSKQKKMAEGFREQLDKISQTSIISSKNINDVNEAKNLEKYSCRYKLLETLNIIYQDTKYNFSPQKNISYDYFIPSEKLVVFVLDDNDYNSVNIKKSKKFARRENLDVVFWKSDDDVTLQNIVKYKLINRR